MASQISYIRPYGGKIRIKTVNQKRPWYITVSWDTSREEHRVRYGNNAGAYPITIEAVGTFFLICAIGGFPTKQAAKNHFVKKCLSKGW